MINLIEITFNDKIYFKKWNINSKKKLQTVSAVYWIIPFCSRFFNHPQLANFIRMFLIKICQLWIFPEAKEKLLYPPFLPVMLVHQNLEASLSHIMVWRLSENWVFYLKKKKAKKKKKMNTIFYITLINLIFWKDAWLNLLKWKIFNITRIIQYYSCNVRTLRTLSH